MVKIISLDMQGTLTQSTFSDYFWLEFLPKKYSEKFYCTIEKAKQNISKEFCKLGKYNILYYDDRYWAKKLDFDTKKELDNFIIRPKFNNELYDFIQTIKLPKIIVSTTTDLFINYELDGNIKDFNRVYSCVDDFKTGGKTKDIFLKICNELHVCPNEVLHIGDSKLMDYENARKAGINAILFNGDLTKLKRDVNKYLEV